jgi:hypothetical protein
LKKTLAHILHRFRGVQHLTLVVGYHQKHVQKDYNTPPLESDQELVLHKHDIFESDKWGIGDGTFRLPEKGDAGWCRNMVRSLRKELKDFQAYKEMKDAIKGRLRWIIPLIDFKIELPRDFLERLRKELAYHDAKRAARGYRLTAAELRYQNLVGNVRHIVRLDFADSVI